MLHKRIWMLSCQTLRKKMFVFFLRCTFLFNSGHARNSENSQYTQYEHLLGRSVYWKRIIMLPTSTQKEAKRNPDKSTAILHIYFYQLWPGSALLSAILNGGFSHSAKFYENLNFQEDLMKLLTLKKCQSRFV